MKLADVGQPDDFSNQETSLVHLFRIQKARTYEFVLYFNKLGNKAEWDEIDANEIPFLINRSSHWLEEEKELGIHEDDRELLNQQEVNAYTIKAKRMIDAKKAYEDAGGTYEVD